jgi:secernin
MCDTLVATPEHTGGHVMLFGKNSDRQRNEAQAVEYFPGAEHVPDVNLPCTYIEIPQVRHTHAVLLCRPFWIWGAEMGANEHGVVIGNEGLYARCAAPEEKTLVGMDLVRLALERAASAAEATNVITTLLELHGQGGNCGHLTPAYYHNSFLIADPDESYVLETVGREWLIERVRGVQAISNHYTIGSDVERTSAGLSALLQKLGWNGQGSPNYAEVIADPTQAHIGSACERRARAISFLDAGKGSLSAANIMTVLREHDSTGLQQGTWGPDRALKHGLCVHAGDGNRDCQTTGAMVSEIRTKDSVHWVTGTAAPCISIFKPVLMDVPLPQHGPTPEQRFDPDALWWRHERLHRAALLSDFSRFLNDIRTERDELETDFRNEVSSVLNGGSFSERRMVIEQCWKVAMETEDRWYTRVDRTVRIKGTPYRNAWLKLNRLAGLTQSPDSRIGV